MTANIIKYCTRMDQMGWVANHDGNITVRRPLNGSGSHGGGGYIATPTARAKGDLTERDLLVLDQDGKKVEGTGGVFSEFQIHQRIYKARPDVGAIVHAHPPFVTAVGCAGQELLLTAIPEAVVSLGPLLPLVSLALPNSDALWSELDPLIPRFNAVMIGGNGVFAWGTDLEQAFLRLELCEHVAQICMRSLALGGPKLLSQSQVNELSQKRKAAGLAPPLF